MNTVHPSLLTRRRLSACMTSVVSFVQTRQPAKRCDGLCSSTATPGLAVNAGRLSNCASSCQMARPVLSFDRAINQSPGKREDLSQCAAIQLGLKPKAQVHSRVLCGLQTEHAHKKRGGCSGHTRYLEIGTALGSHSSGFSLCLANRLVADAFPASCEEDRGDLQQNAAARRLRP